MRRLTRIRPWRAPVLLATVAFLASAVPVFPAGFSIFEQGAKATAMGGAFAAQADDPSAIFYNPAGLGFQDHYSLLVGTTLITDTHGTFDGANPIPGVGDHETLHKTPFFPTHLYLVAPLTSNLKFGIGVFTPFGLGIRWNNPETFSGRHIAQNTFLQTISIEPVFAWRVTSTFSIAAGAEYRTSNVKLEQDQAAVDPFTLSADDVAHVKLTANNGHSWGWNAGFLWKPVPAFSIGASYRAAMNIHYDGSAKFTQRLTGDPQFDQLVAAQLPSTIPARTAISYPAVADGGVAYHFIPAGVTIEADAVWSEWSKYKNLDIIFPGGQAPNLYRVTNWSNSWSYRAGIEKKFSAIALRAGYVYDQTPQPDREVAPILPDANRRGYCLGVGYDTEGLGIDLADMYLPFADRNTHGKSQDNFNGTYKVTANLFGLDLRLSF